MLDLDHAGLPRRRQRATDIRRRQHYYARQLTITIPLLGEAARGCQNASRRGPAAFRPFIYLCYGYASGDAGILACDCSPASLTLGLSRAANTKNIGGAKALSLFERLSRPTRGCGPRRALPRRRPFVRAATSILGERT